MVASQKSSGPSGTIVVVLLLGFAGALAVVAYSFSPRIRLSPRAPAMELRLAVLAFENVTAEPELEALAMDIGQDVAFELLRAPEMPFELVSERQVLGFEGVRTAPTSARYLGASYLLTGNVNRVGQDIVVEAYLIRLQEVPRAWAEKFERSDDAIPTIPAEISTRIVEALSALN